MPLVISLAPASDTPLFRQIMRQIRRDVATGRLAVGEQLPAVRLLAETQVINPNTVARAYQDLIRDGVLESRAGRGVFVAERRQVFSAAERKRRLGQAAENLCHEGLLSDSSLPELREVLENTWNSLQRETTQERKKK